MVVAKLPSVGFKFTTDQLFWLAALPGISGAVLRIFYSFMVPIFGGRLWTTLATWSLMIPAVGIGYAVQNPNTPYFVFLALALLCGFGGGNFASSMANISFFFPRSEKGNALALNAGLGNLGVSVVQFVVPIVITAGVFGWFGGDPAMVQGGSRQAPLWLQNAGFIWVPFIAASAFAAWFGMNDIASAKASFSEQAVIFQRKHNWLMCWLYTGTFGSFIGYSAGFPLLAEDPVPGCRRAAVRVPRSAGRRAVALGDRLGLRPMGRRPRHPLGFRPDDGRRLGVLYFLGIKDQPGAFWGFFAMFLLLFFATGVGNASTFQMIPNIMRKEIERLMPQLDADDAPAAGREGIRRHYRIHLRDRSVRRVLYSEILRNIDRSYRRSAGCAVGFLHLLRDLPRRSPGPSTPDRAACFTTSSARRARFRPRPARRMKESSRHEPFSRPAVLLHAAEAEFSDGHGIITHRGPLLGGRLPQALAARQDRALDPWRELHRLLLVEGLRQGRHRHLGNAADRLSAHAARPAQSRAARLLARCRATAGISIPAIG